MDQTLFILTVGDPKDDIGLLLHALRSSGYEVTHERVNTAEEMTEALTRKRWDIVLADSAPFRLSDFVPLNLLRDHGLDIPYILVSGAISEDALAEVVKAGGNDYIMKGNTKDLLLVVERELGQIEKRRKGKLTQDALRQSEERFRQLAENINEVFFMTNADATSMIYMSPAYENIWGRSRQSIYDNPFSWLEGLYPEDRTKVAEVR